MQLWQCEKMRIWDFLSVTPMVRSSVADPHPTPAKSSNRIPPPSLSLSLPLIIPTWSSKRYTQGLSLFTRGGQRSEFIKGPRGRRGKWRGRCSPTWNPPTPSKISSVSLLLCPHSRMLLFFPLATKTGCIGMHSSYPAHKRHHKTWHIFHALSFSIFSNIHI